MTEHIFQKNDSVRLKELIDGLGRHPLDKYIGQKGVIIKPGTGKTLETMIIVKFDNGKEDAFWPEELESIL